jgi:hypothetical protein
VYAGDPLQGPVSAWCGRGSPLAGCGLHGFVMSSPENTPIADAPKSIRLKCGNTDDLVHIDFAVASRSALLLDTVNDNASHREVPEPVPVPFSRSTVMAWREGSVAPGMSCKDLLDAVKVRALLEPAPTRRWQLRRECDAWRMRLTSGAVSSMLCSVAQRDASVIKAISPCDCHIRAHSGWHRALTTRVSWLTTVAGDHAKSCTLLTPA